MRRALRMRGVLSRTRRVHGLDVHYYCAEGTGSAPPLLLVHGLGSSAHSFFRALLPLTKVFRQVWALDLPGSGFSPMPTQGPLPLLQYVDVVLEFRRSVIGQRVVLLGNSLGGGISLFAAAREPESFAALALVSPAGARLAPHRLEQVLESFRVHTAADARKLAHKLFAKAPLPLLVFADELRKMVSTDTVKSIIANAHPDEHVTEEMLARLTMPTLLIWGRNEKLLPGEALEYFRTHLPRGAEVDEVDDFGHMPQMEHPEAFVDRIARFARQHLT
jgi:pimeloyl-ACP methyl ester carboxylesterase